MTDTHQAPPATILVVEDNQFVRHSTALALQDHGYRVLMAADGPAALELLEQGETIDLLLSDVVMPGGLNGQELADRICRLAPAVKVVLISAYPKEELLDSGKVTDDTTLLMKPFRQQELEQVIRELLAPEVP